MIKYIFLTLPDWCITLKEYTHTHDLQKHAQILQHFNYVMLYVFLFLKLTFTL